jgi:hypothetical protein
MKQAGILFYAVLNSCFSNRTALQAYTTKTKSPSEPKGETERKFVKTKEIEEVQVWRPPDENRIFGGEFSKLAQVGMAKLPNFTVEKKRSSHCP